MSHLKKRFGADGEEIACHYLEKHRYQIVDRNFRIRNGEIDIIAIDRSENPHVLVFVEVKTRKSDRYGTPLEAIGYHKLQAILRAAALYQISHPKLPQLLRLDAVAITINDEGNTVSIDLVKNISQ